MKHGWGIRQKKSRPLKGGPSQQGGVIKTGKGIPALRSPRRATATNLTIIY